MKYTFYVVCNICIKLNYFEELSGIIISIKCAPSEALSKLLLPCHESVTNSILNAKRIS